MNMIMLIPHPKHYLMLWHVSRRLVLDKYLFLFLFSSQNIVHRENGHRIIHEKLTGSASYRGALFDLHEKQ